MKNYRRYSILDRVLIELNNSLTTLLINEHKQDNYPAKHLTEPQLSESQQKEAASYMRVNHAGEVSAQALYRGHALVARTQSARETFEQCCAEEADHLAWCEQRLSELQNHPSYLNFFWYWNSLAIGIIAGLLGDRWSLGFVEETEIQVSKHLQHHLRVLPTQDSKSRAVVQQMQIDEERHRSTAAKSGAAPLPLIVKKIMSLQAKVMTTLAYWV